MDSESENKLIQGCKLFNATEFFEAHEFFEELWQEAISESDQRNFLFLVRLAAGGVHLTNQNLSSLFLFHLAHKDLLEKNLALEFLQDLGSLEKNLFDLITDLTQCKRENMSLLVQNFKVKLVLGIV